MTDLRRSIVKRLSKNAAPSRIQGQFSRGLSKALGFSICKVESYDLGCEERLDPLIGSDLSEVAEPRPVQDELRVHRKPLGLPQPMVFKDVGIWSDSSLFKRGNTVYAPPVSLRFIDEILWRNGDSCEWDGPGTVVVREPTAQNLDRGLCLFGHGAGNWYHWLIEILPKALRAQELGKQYDDLPWLVPRHVIDSPNFRAGFELFRGSREVITLEPGVRYQIKEMVVLPSPTFGPFNLVAGLWPRPDHYLQDVSVMTRYRDHILRSCLEKEARDFPKRVFLARGAGRRSYNQDEIVSVAEQEGFTPVFPEELTFAEQVNLFHGADYVIGNSGAAWSGALFMRAGSKSIVWVPQEFSGGCFFSSLAHVGGSEMFYHYTKLDRPPISTEDIHFQDMRVSPERLTRDLKLVLAGT